MVRKNGTIFSLTSIIDKDPCFSQTLKCSYKNLLINVKRLTILFTSTGRQISALGQTHKICVGIKRICELWV